RVIGQAVVIGQGRPVPVDEATIPFGLENGVGEEVLEGPSQQRLIETDDLRNRTRRALLQHDPLIFHGTRPLVHNDPCSMKIPPCDPDPYRGRTAESIFPVGTLFYR